MGIEIRMLAREDMPKILQIEKDVCEYPWNYEEIKETLFQRWCIGYVAVFEGIVIGFMLFEMKEDSLFLLKFTVDKIPNKTYLVGTSMVNFLRNKLNLQNRTKIQILVDESNVESQLFFSSQEFQCVEIIKGFNLESEYLFEFNLYNEETKPRFINRISQYLENQEW